MSILDQSDTEFLHVIKGDDGFDGIASSHASSHAIDEGDLEQRQTLWVGGLNEKVNGLNARPTSQLVATEAEYFDFQIFGELISAESSGLL